MKRIVTLVLVILVLISSFGCFSNNEIKYSLDYGKKIESLQESEQEKIKGYVEDCKTIYVNTYVEKCKDAGLDLYISFGDVFVYDFSKCNPDSAEEAMEQKLWEKIKQVNKDGKLPKTYIELGGYANYLPGYSPLTIAETGIINGFFIYEDQTVIQVSYKRICASIYVYKFPNATEVINCGDKFAEEITFDSESEADFPKELKILKQQI